MLLHGVFLCQNVDIKHIEGAADRSHTKVFLLSFPQLCAVWSLVIKACRIMKRKKKSLVRTGTLTAAIMQAITLNG